MARRTEKTRMARTTQMTVENNRARVGTLGISHSQFRIIGQHRANSHQDGIMGSAQPVGEGQRIRPAQCLRGAAACRDASIQALGVTQCNQRAI